jgi:hypothetical protein
MVRVINAVFTASAGIAAREDAQAQLCALAEAECRRNVATEHPGYAALQLRQLGLYASPAIYQPELVRVVCFYGYTLIRAPLTA